MAKRKKQSGSGESSGGWLNTYADMVTLLLCFFVMMYTASVPDEARMQWILQSFAKLSGSVINPVVVHDPDNPYGDDESVGPNEPSSPEGENPGIVGELPKTWEDMFNWTTEIINSSDFGESVSVEMFPGRMHIRFDSDVMFEPDSAELLPAGRQMLDLFTPGIRAINQYIETAEIQGHTAPLPGGRDGLNHMGLSAARAVSVHTHLNFSRRMVDTEKFRVEGLGPWQTHYPTDDPVLNAKNRRVELVLTRNDFGMENTPMMLDMLEHDFMLGPIPNGPLDSRQPEPGNFPRAEQIRMKILDRYNLPADTLANPPPNVPGRDFDFPVPQLPVIPSAS